MYVRICKDEDLVYKKSATSMMMTLQEMLLLLKGRSVLVFDWILEFSISRGTREGDNISYILHP